MISHLKFSKKMLRYGYGLKLNRGLGIFFGITGLFLIVGAFINPDYNFRYMYPGGMLLSMTGAMPVQSWMSFNSAGIVLSSPRCKASMCAIPALMLGVSSVLGFSLSLLVCLIVRLIYPIETLQYIRGIYMTAFSITSIFLFFAICYRYFVAATLLYLFSFPAISGIGYVALHHLQQRYADSVFFTLPVTVVVCYCLLLAGSALSYLCLRLLYKKPISKLAQGARLRRYL